MNSNLIRLSVIDDHPIVFMGVQLAIRKMKPQSIVFENQYTRGSELIENMANLNSDVLLIDMRLPDMNGSELTAKILEVYPKMNIGIYSNMLDCESILGAFKSGVLGYLPKSADAAEIVDFIVTISKGERYFSGVVADIIFENAVQVEKNKQLKITKRESEVLQLVLEGLKNREIADKLSIAERTVEFHKQNIYLKFEVTSSVDLYKAALSQNLFQHKTSGFY